MLEYIFLYARTESLMVEKIFDSFSPHKIKEQSIMSIHLRNKNEYNKYIQQKKLMLEFLSEHLELFKPNPEIMKYMDDYFIRQEKISKFVEMDFFRYNMDGSMRSRTREIVRDMHFIQRLIRKSPTYTSISTKKYTVGH